VKWLSQFVAGREQPEPRAEKESAKSDVRLRLRTEMVEIAFNELGRKRQGIHQNALHAVLGQGDAKRQATEGTRSFLLQ
jgi:hypothetical protein